MKLLRNFILFFFLYSCCAAQELVNFSSYTPQTDPFMGKVTTHNPYWDLYIPISDITRNKFIIFPTPYNPGSKVRAISFFLTHPFLMTVFPNSFDFPITHLGKTNLLSLLDRYFLLNSSDRYLYIVLNEKDCYSSEKTDIFNSLHQKIIPSHVLNLSVLKEFHNLFPLFPSEIFDNISSLKSYNSFKNHIEPLLDYHSLSEIETNVLEYLNNSEKHPIKKQEVLSEFMEDLYFSIKTEDNENFVVSLVKKQKYSELFLRFNEHIVENSLWSFPFIKKYAAEICWSFKNTKSKEAILPLLYENLLKALSTDHSNVTGTRALFSEIFPNIKIPENGRCNPPTITTMMLLNNMVKQEETIMPQQEYINLETLQKENSSLTEENIKLEERNRRLSNLQEENRKLKEENIKLKREFTSLQETHKRSQDDWKEMFFFLDSTVHPFLKRMRPN